MSKQRLVNKDKLIAFIKFNGFVCANALETFPEVDAIEVVRCKDCKHVDYSGCINTTAYCLKNECYTQEDCYCSYGERESEVKE